MTKIFPNLNIKVSLFSACPHIQNGCDLGIVIERKKLIHRLFGGDIEQMAQEIGVKVLRYQTVDYLLRAILGE